MFDATAAQAELRKYVDPEKVVLFPKFFKAGAGEYAEGDKFLGITVPNIRIVAKQGKDFSLAETEKLL